MKGCEHIYMAGIALVPTTRVHADFAGDLEGVLPGIAYGDPLPPEVATALHGQTISMGGPGKIVPCRKCIKCGHSIR